MRRSFARGASGLVLAVATGVFFALPAAQAQTATVDVRIVDYKFVPARLSVKTGTTVRWINDEKRTTHSVLFTGADGFESERFFPGESWQRRFDKPGTYAYTCGPHPEMKGELIVTD